MRQYYSSSKFVNWLRKKVFKVDKPHALGLGEWRKWDEELAKNRPIANFFTETLPDFCGRAVENVTAPYDNTRIYISNRLAGTHYLRSTLEKGKYHELGKRMLYANFDAFAEFIEIEEASMHVVWSDKAERAKYWTPLWKRIWSGQFTWRCPQAGIDHLKWEMTLNTPPDPPDPNWQSSPRQAEDAFHKMVLYTWWRETRPNRKDEFIASGLSDFWEKMDVKYGTTKETGGWLGFANNSKLTKEESIEYHRLSKLSNSIEEGYRLEDDEMLIKLIKMRDSLWT